MATTYGIYVTSSRNEVCESLNSFPQFTVIKCVQPYWGLPVRFYRRTLNTPRGIVWR